MRIPLSVMELEWVFVPFDMHFIHFLTKHLKIKWSDIVTHYFCVPCLQNILFCPTWFTNSRYIMGMMKHLNPLKLEESSITGLCWLYCFSSNLGSLDSYRRWCPLSCTCQHVEQWQKQQLQLQINTLIVSYTGMSKKCPLQKSDLELDNSYR